MIKKVLSVLIFLLALGLPVCAAQEQPPPPQNDTAKAPEKPVNKSEQRPTGDAAATPDRNAPQSTQPVQTEPKQTEEKTTPTAQPSPTPVAATDNSSTKAKAETTGGNTTAQQQSEAKSSVGAAAKVAPASGGAVTDAADFYKIGLAHYESKQFKDAVDAFKRALRLKPDDANIHYNLGMAYYSSNQYKDAAKAYQQAVRLKPNWPDAHFRLGWIYYVLGKKEASFEEYRILQTLSAEQANTLYRIIKVETPSTTAGPKKETTAGASTATQPDPKEEAKVESRLIVSDISQPTEPTNSAPVNTSANTPANASASSPANISSNALTNVPANTQPDSAAPVKESDAKHSPAPTTAVPTAANSSSATNAAHTTAGETTPGATPITTATATPTMTLNAPAKTTTTKTPDNSPASVNASTSANPSMSLNPSASAPATSNAPAPSPSGATLSSNAASLSSTAPSTNSPAKEGGESSGLNDEASLVKSYRVGVGDVLDIRLVNTPTTRSTLYTVMEGGRIEYPLAGGPMSVSGLTTEEINARLSAELKRRAVNQNPNDIMVVVRDYVSHNVVISGLVNSPGMRILHREAVPLYVVLADAQPRIDASRALIMRASGQVPVDLTDPAQMNVLVRSGDVITVSARPPQFYYLGGKIMTPGQKPFQPGITLVQAILAAGGLLERASGDVIDVSREGADGRLATTKYKLKDIRAGKVPDPRLQPGDRIEVSH